MRIAALSNGVDYGGVVQTSASGMRFCATINISGGKNLDEIDVWHYTSLYNVAPGSRVGIDGTDVISHDLKVKTNGSNKNIVEGKTNPPESVTSESETVTGLRYSAYQPDAVNYIDDGVYYIVPVLSENKVLSEKEKPEDDAKTLEVEPFRGYKRQKWLIEKITDPAISPGYRENDTSTYEYKIIEQARYKALTIIKDENVIFNQISAGRYFNNYKRDNSQIWKIEPVGDGTYRIKTVAPYTLTDGENSGYLAVNTNDQAESMQGYAMIGRYNKDTERYKLVSANYYNKGGE